jgi:uncharacterized Zn finger protein
METQAQKTMNIDGNEIPYNQKYERFIEDMENAGIKIRFYRGRNYYRGPAVEVEDLQEALSETKVRCLWEGMGGSDVIVYPG